MKDLKANYMNNPTCRLINPSKSTLDKLLISVLDCINGDVKAQAKVNSWKNTASVLRWFKDLNVTNNHLSVVFNSWNSIHLFHPNCYPKLLIMSVDLPLSLIKNVTL